MLNVLFANFLFSKPENTFPTTSSFMSSTLKLERLYPFSFKHTHQCFQSPLNIFYIFFASLSYQMGGTPSLCNQPIYRARHELKVLVSLGLGFPFFLYFVSFSFCILIDTTFNFFLKFNGLLIASFKSLVSNFFVLRWFFVPGT